jgi:pSer/pThr/pTyr-binding forkhead associated (FHA) protein
VLLRKYSIILKQTIIGRNPNFHIHVNDISVQAKHALLDLSPDKTKVFLVDLGAPNGCYVND